MQFIGIDLAVGGPASERGAEQPAPPAAEQAGAQAAEQSANESGLAVLDERGTVLDAGWARGIDEIVAWVLATAEPGAVLAIDAPLVIPSAAGGRGCERELGTCYGKWKVSAIPSGHGATRQPGVLLRSRLEEHGFVCADGTRPAAADRRTVIECAPATTLVGMWELGYDEERPRYKRLAPRVEPAQARKQRADECDDLLRRMAALAVAETPLDLASHPVTAQLRDEASPLEDGPYRHREDLIDAVLCAWTAAIWARYPARTQVLGATDEPDADGRRPTIVAPARPEQRLAARSKVKRDLAPKRGTASVDTALATVRDLQQLTATLTTRLRALERDLIALRAPRPGP